MNDTQQQMFFLSLPTVLRQRICDYGEATDVLALASTCSTIRNELNLSVLRKTYTLLRLERFHGSSLNETKENGIRFGASIPIFFPSHCHSVRLIFKWRDEGTWHQSARISVVSQPKVGEFLGNDTSTIVNDTGDKGKLIWQSPLEVGLKMVDLTFRCDCSLNYSLWYQCHGRGHSLRIDILEARRFLLWDDEFRTRMKSYEKCIAFDDDVVKCGDYIETENPFERSNLLYHLPVVPLFAQLFAHSLDLLDCASDEEKSFTCDDPLSSGERPTLSFFESSESGIGSSMSHGTLMGLKMLAEIYLQLVGGTASRCDDVKLRGGRDFVVQGRRRALTLPNIRLVRQICWEELSRNDDSYDMTVDLNSYPCRPRVVERIPLVSGTESFRLTVQWESRPPVAGEDECVDEWITVFTVLTPHAAEQRSQCDTVVYNGRPVGKGYHQTLEMPTTRKFFNQSFVVDPEAVGCYVCVFPREQDRHFVYVNSVTLSVSLPKVQTSPEELFDCFFGLFRMKDEREVHTNYVRTRRIRFERTTFKGSFHLGLLRALASELHLALTSRSDDRHAAVIGSLSKLLSDKGFATEKLGLECLVELIDTILVQRGLPRKLM
jgi:hypothetical protein